MPDAKMMVAAFTGGLVLSASAMADDMTRGMPNDRVPAPFSWTGLYAGLTAGAAVNHASTTLSSINGVTPNYRPEDVPLVNALGSGTFKQSKAMIGGRAGYNIQMGALVLGAEGDLSSLRFRASRTATGNPFPGETNPPFFATFDQTASSAWIGTLRGRLGLALGRALIYGTGGLAVGEADFGYSAREFSFNGLGFGAASGGASKVKTGWAAGGGVEYALTSNVIIHSEYLRMDLGSVSASGIVTSSNTATATHQFTTNIRSDVIRAGISYKF